MTDINDLDEVQAKGWSLISGGAAYNLTLEFYPDMVWVKNYTQAGTTAKLVDSWWMRGMPAGDAIQIQTVIDSASTGNVSGALETTNGFTWAGASSGFADQHVTITGATAASPVVLTAASHGLSNGDRLRVTQIVGMRQLNGREFVVGDAAVNTLGLYDVYGNAIDGTAYTAYDSAGQITKQDESAATVDVTETFIMTLGTAVMGTDSDVLYVMAMKFPGGVKALGDIGV